MSDDSPAVSVVIPTHDRGDVIVRAVTSVLRQDSADLEVIVVDDASTDDTAIGRRRRSPMPACTMCHRIAVGAAEARNIGARRGRAPLADVPRQRRHRDPRLAVEPPRRDGRARHVVGELRVRGAGGGDRRGAAATAAPPRESVGRPDRRADRDGRLVPARSCVVPRDRRLRRRATRRAASGARAAPRPRHRRRGAAHRRGQPAARRTLGGPRRQHPRRRRRGARRARSASSTATVNRLALDRSAARRTPRPPLRTAPSGSVGSSEARRLALLARQDPRRGTCDTGRASVPWPYPAWRAGARSRTDPVPTSGGPCDHVSSP